MNKIKKGYFDFDFDIEKVMDNCGLSDIFLYQDLKQRKLFLESEIDTYTVSDAIKNIMQYNADDKDIPIEERKPILLYISSPGGEVDSGFALIDAILCSKTPVYTINMGKAYSMGFLIYIAGHKRFSYPNSRFLLHDGSSFVYDSGNKVMDRMKFEQKSEERIKQYVLAHSNLSEDLYNENARVEWWLFPEEAKECGFTDYIVGVDCELGEVI